MNCNVFAILNYLGKRLRNLSSHCVISSTDTLHGLLSLIRRLDRAEAPYWLETHVEVRNTMACAVFFRNFDNNTPFGVIPLSQRVIVDSAKPSGEISVSDPTSTTGLLKGYTLNPPIL